MAKKKKRKMKPIKEQLWKLVARSVKERDNYTCQLCGLVGTGSEIHGSHILPKGLYPRYEFDERNIKALCYHCHIARWHKDPLHIALEFKKKHPKKYKLAFKMAKEYPKQKKYTREQLLDLIEMYKKKFA